MNQKLIYAGISAVLLLASCGNIDIDNDTGNGTNSERFTKVTIGGDTLEKDNLKKLEWIGSAGADGKACQANPVADDEVGAIAHAKDHCFALVFAGYDDWRVPTASEQSEMIIKMRDAGQTPFYTVPSCPRLMGVDGTTATAINTHNSNPVGRLTAWAVLLDQNKTNYGVKCVRNF